MANAHKEASQVALARTKESSLVKSFGLVKEFTRTDFKLRYQDSILGYFWSILRPLTMFLILYLVFAYFFKLGKDTPHFATYLFAGVVFWAFFTEATMTSLSSIVERGELIRKTNFPKLVIVLSRLFAASINMAINTVVIIVLVLLVPGEQMGATVSWTIVFLPLLIIELLVLAFALSLMLSALYVKFRDVGQIWEVFLQVAYYLTPVLYPMSVVLSLGPGETIAKFMVLNPLAQIIQDIRYIAITPQTVGYASLFENGAWRLIPISFVVILLIVSIKFFKSQEARFAEYV